jgi:hypothetical protein
VRNRHPDAPAADSLSIAVQRPILVTALGELHDPVVSARGAIGDEAVDQAHAEGEAMELGRAMAYANGET